MLNHDMIRKILIVLQMILAKYFDMYRPAIIYTAGSPFYTIIGFIYVGTLVYMTWYTFFRKDC